ncbi:hypothetical protein VJ923_06125 [Adlercreutzia sp. R25]|uniref:Uncharacterized protein n=1 Tax=Adlercreutzia shanghongiae TaxID=3111773 RepID=A0ABU6IX00_9ACTN|nr:MULTISPECIES: hypothetical protein [unclassified Adlercreutzia]MEC4272729.1 hypothetical protein [Adlercreutzia sp. R25]MEC4294372.1 hypothetical protein [Adlercreutzia sp. R22]
MTKKLITVCDRCGRDMSEHVNGVSMRVKRHTSTYASDDIVRTYDLCKTCGTAMIDVINGVLDGDAE